MPFSATADGKVSAGTCSLTEDCHAGPNSAIPLPTMKQNASRISGVTRPSHASTDRAVAPTSAIDSETSATMRRVMAGLDSLPIQVMPAKVLGCPVLGALSAVTQGG